MNIFNFGRNWHGWANEEQKSVVTLIRIVIGKKVWLCTDCSQTVNMGGECSRRLCHSNRQVIHTNNFYARAMCYMLRALFGKTVSKNWRGVCCAKPKITSPTCSGADEWWAPQYDSTAYKQTTLKKAWFCVANPIDRNWHNEMVVRVQHATHSVPNIRIHISILYPITFREKLTRARTHTQHIYCASADEDMSLSKIIWNVFRLFNYSTNHFILLCTIVRHTHGCVKKQPEESFNPKEEFVSKYCVCWKDLNSCVLNASRCVVCAHALNFSIQRVSQVRQRRQTKKKRTKILFENCVFIECMAWHGMRWRGEWPAKECRTMASSNDSIQSA